MPVFEIKDPGRSASLPPKPLRRKKIFPTLPVSTSRAISELLSRREWRQGRGKRTKSKDQLDHDSVRRACRQTEEVNNHLERQGIKIHLLLIVDDKGFSLDVYDCSSGEVCRVIHDRVVGIDELPNLLNRLQQQSGIILDEKM